MKKLIITGWGPKLTLIIPANISSEDLCAAINATPEIRYLLTEIEEGALLEYVTDELLKNNEVIINASNGTLEFTINEIELFELFQG
jgi:hypothetical protein